MKWWRSRYVQHLEQENAELRATIQRMLSPQWRYLMYGTAIDEIQESNARPADNKVEKVRIPPRKSWQQIRDTVEPLFYPENIVARRDKQRKEALKEAING